MRSHLSDPTTFCACDLRLPARTGSAQTRTLGAPSTFIMQFGQCPEQQSSPLGRWYLKLRENTR